MSQIMQSSSLCFFFGKFISCLEAKKLRLLVCANHACTQFFGQKCARKTPGKEYKIYTHEDVSIVTICEEGICEGFT